ncbi:MAG: TonB-dependent receptor [Bacteroidales bacterium]|nr:TonB-dependent receptor [Bacteroidales bacterium]
MRKFLPILTLFASLLFAQMAYAQVTTSGMNGKVIDVNGEPLTGATLIVVETQTSSEYATVSDPKGYYYLPNMNPGGPYKLTVSFVGFETFVKSEIYLTLGQTLKVDVELSESATELTGVEIVATKNDMFDGNRTGAETVIDREQINAIPSISGDINDFTRLTPQANIVGDGISIAGSNNRYNSVMVDGTINNDVFGLAANGMNGGQTGISAISYEAIDQFQVVIAPYDVRMSGFAGGGINAVTKRGTNEFHGSVYFKYRNQGLAGKTPGEMEDGDPEKLPDFNAKTYGLTVGGPIIKNKLFFFLNAEFQKDETPQPFEFADYTGASTEAELNNLANLFRDEHGYDPGGFLNNTRELNGTKILTRFDYNISKNHKLMLRYQYVYGESIGPRQSNKDHIYFYNSGVHFPSTTHTAAIELKSVFGSKYSNNLKIGLTSVNDDRNVMGDKFPGVTIDDGNGTVHLGGEVYSTGNQLKQNIFSLTDNFQIYKGQHAITIGTHNEFYDIYNLFMRRAYGDYSFDSVSGFMQGDPSSYYRIGYSLVDDVRGDGSAAAADFNALQIGFYVQDEFQVNSKLKITGGIRLDIPIFMDDPIERPGFNDTTIVKLEAYYDLKGARSGAMPKSQFLWSPRVGFNWDIYGDASFQLRGGTGIFTSRVPFVWPAGSYTNNGMMIGDYKDYGAPFNPDWQSQPVGGADAPSGSQIDLYTEDFKFPQVWRTNLALDKKLPGDIIGTVEFIYTKTINNVLWKDVNIKPAFGNATGTPDDRQLYNTYKNGIESEYGQIMLGDNTNEGYTYNITAQLRKRFECGLFTSLAYTYGKAESMFDGTSSQNSSQWNYLVSSPVPRNEVQLAISDFDLGSRIVGVASYKIEYANHLATSFALVYNGQTGRPFSYIYNDYYGNFTNEAYKGPQLIYIPKEQSDIIFVGTADEQQAQWEELDAFITQDKYLSEHRGEYATRNASRLPWTNIFDFKIAQDIFYSSGTYKHTLQITLDIFNVGNLLSKDWGRRYYASNNNIGIIKFEDFQDDNTTPEFSFTRPDNDEAWYLDDSGLNSSRWQAMIGVRYKF